MCVPPKRSAASLTGKMAQVLYDYGITFSDIHNCALQRKLSFNEATERFYYTIFGSASVKEHFGKEV